MELHNCEWCIQIVFESAKDGLWKRAGLAFAARQRQRAIPAVEGGAGLRQLLRRPVERVAVMRHQEGEADRFARRICEDIAHRRDVAERFRHLDAVDGQHLVVHPDPREGMARMRALALRVAAHERRGRLDEVPQPLHVLVRLVARDRLAQLR